MAEIASKKISIAEINPLSILTIGGWMVESYKDEVAGEYFDEGDHEDFNFLWGYFHCININF